MGVGAGSRARRQGVAPGELGEDGEPVGLELLGHRAVHGGVVERDPGGLLRLEEAPVLAPLAGADDVAGRLELLDPGGDGVHPVADQRGEPPDGEDPFGVALQRADLAVDALGLQAQRAVEEHGVLDVGEGAFAPVHHIAHGAPPFSWAARLRSACSSSSRARTMRPSISSRVAEGSKNRAMLLLGIFTCSTWLGFSSSMIDWTSAGVRQRALE